MLSKIAQTIFQNHVMKILNLNEGSFPIKLSFELENHNVPNIGKLTNNLAVEAQYLKYLKTFISVMAV